MSSPFTMETNVLDIPTTCAKSVGMGSSQIIFNTLGHVVQQCVLNQSQSYWLLSNALATIVAFVCQL